MSGGSTRASKTAPPDAHAASELAAAARALDATLAPLCARLRAGGRATHVLRPLDYALANHQAYIERHARAPVEAVLFGMNPGPWGMAQTGVPFGDPALVRDFLAIDGAVAAPADAHPRCPIRGVASPRCEVSGQRLWGGVRACFATTQAFFARFFVANYCPLLFLDERGANVTPDKLPAGPMAEVLQACDEHARTVVRVLAPRRAIGIGAWATKQLARALAKLDTPLAVGTLLHPSPASPLANRGWLAAARRQLADMGCPWPEPRKEK